MRTLGRRMRCLILGHRPVRMITGLAPEGWDGFRVTASRLDCGRCGRALHAVGWDCRPAWWQRVRLGRRP
nr:hypothetical protein [Micromonospora sp. DSM 115978]